MLINLLSECGRERQALQDRVDVVSVAAVIEATTGPHLDGPVVEDLFNSAGRVTTVAAEISGGGLRSNTTRPMRNKK